MDIFIVRTDKIRNSFKSKKEEEAEAEEGPTVLGTSSSPFPDSLCNSHITTAKKVEGRQPRYRTFNRRGAVLISSHSDKMSLHLSNLVFLVVLAAVLIFASPAYCFGAGNVPSQSKVEGRNWRHGDIEDTLKALAFLKGGKWASKMVKRVYFGNWLRDYSQAVDVGTLKGVPAETLRVLVSSFCQMDVEF